MNNERDIKRRLSSGTDIKPPAGLLESIQQEIPEETFGPRTTAPLESTGRGPWRVRLAAAAVVLLGAGLLAVGVLRDGGLPRALEPVSEAAEVSERANLEVSRDEIAAEPVEGLHEEAAARLRGLGYLEADKDSDAKREERLIDTRRRELQRRLEVADSANSRQAAIAEQELKAAPQRERAVDRSQRTRPAATSVAQAPAAPVAGPEDDLKAPEVSASKAKKPSSSENAFRPPAAQERPAEEAEAEDFDFADSEVERITVTSEAPMVSTPPTETSRATAREVVAESVAEGARSARRAPASPAPRLQASLGESRLDVERIPGVEAVDVLFERGAFRLHAQLEPEFGLEIEGLDQEWLEVPLAEARVVRYELDEDLLGELIPGRRLRLRTLPPDSAGGPMAFSVTIPPPP